VGAGPAYGAAPAPALGGTGVAAAYGAPAGGYTHGGVAVGGVAGAGGVGHVGVGVGAGAGPGGRTGAGSRGMGMAALGLCACGGPSAGPEMSYVGNGRGVYIQETAYKYVGDGAGEFDIIQQKSSVNWSRILIGIGVGLLCILLVLLVILLMRPGTTTTTTTTTGYPYDCDAGLANWKVNWINAKKEWCCRTFGRGCKPPPVKKSCLIWGDPHINGFDAPAHADFFFEGEVWMVKSADVHIQARYRATQFTHGLAATETIAVGGRFLQGHVVEVGPMESGKIQWDGKEILTEFPGSFDMAGLGKIEYNGEGELVDNAMNHLERHIVHVNLPSDVHLQIMRWSHHINVKITMLPAEGGQDGHCGNFNDEASDDDTESIMARVGNTIDRKELLFHTYLKTSEAKTLTLDDCPRTKLEEAAKTCKQARPDIKGRDFETCKFDVCFGGDAYAKQDSVY